MSIQTIAIVGAGTMGHGIAQVCGSAGYDVLIRDVSEDRVRRAIARIDENLGRLVATGQPGQ